LPNRNCAAYPFRDNDWGHSITDDVRFAWSDSDDHYVSPGNVWHAYRNTYLHWHPNGHADGDRDACSTLHSNSMPDGICVSYHHTNHDAYCHGNANAYRDAHWHWHPNHNTHGDACSTLHPDSMPDGICVSYHHTDYNAYCHSDAYAHWHKRQRS
jgi:hypothetical protein